MSTRWTEPEALARDFLIAVHNNDVALVDGWRRNFDPRWLAAVGFVALRIVPALRTTLPAGQQ